MQKSGTIIKNRYKIERELGKGQMANTYLATDNINNSKVVIKILQLKGLPEWKILDLFQRESQLLQKIDHPKIPKYIDYFQEDEEDNVIYYLVYEYIEGKTLEEILKEGHKFTYKEVEDIIVKILDILDFLHNFNPPIIHRDIKPNNIVMKDDKEIYLVDFGAVKTLKSKDNIESGTTFVGTYGFIPLEQMTGNTTPQSDLYALGMTAIKLLTGENPGSFPMKALKPDYKQGKALYDLDKIIDRMIEPDVDKRITSAKKLLSLLKKSRHSRTDFHQPILTEDEIDLEVSNSHYEDLGRIKVQTFDDSITLIVTSEETSGLKKQSSNSVIKDGIEFLLSHSWILILAGIFVIATSFLSEVWILYPLMIFLGVPAAKRFLKRKYSQYEDVEIHLEPDKINVPKQLEKPIHIKRIKNVVVKRKYQKGKVNLKVILYTTNGQRHFYISNLDEDEADEVSGFIIRNIKKRKELLLD